MPISIGGLGSVELLPWKCCLFRLGADVHPPTFANVAFADATRAVHQADGKFVLASRLTRADMLETPVFRRMLLS